MALGEVHPGETLVELGAEELGGARRLRRELCQELIDEIADALLVGGERFGDGHGWTPLSTTGHLAGVDAGHPSSSDVTGPVQRPRNPGRRSADGPWSHAADTQTN